MTDWPEAARVFDERADEYDSWFDKSLLFAIERLALETLATAVARPGLEVGVGPGRFAEALGIEFGIDPARAPLAKAAARGIGVCQAVGEALPFGTATLGSAWLLFSLCFVADPAGTIGECARVIRPGGHLVIGHIPADSPWGELLAAKARQGHPFYRHARFYTTTQVERWLTAEGLEIVERRSTLRQPPAALTRLEAPVAGIRPGAGLAIVVGGSREG